MTLLTLLSNTALTRARNVIDADTNKFTDLLRISGLDPKKHLRFADWSGINFSGDDLRGFDFTGARLHGCDFSNAQIAYACFDQAEIDRAGVEPAGRTRLQAAADWNSYVAGWHKPKTLLPDNHLPVGAVFQDAPFAPEMVVIPSGKFLMGSPEDEPERFENEGPQHEVTITKSFAIGRYAVTFEEWDFAQSDKGWRKITGRKPRKPGDRGWGWGNRPVIDVSWDDADAYTKWLSAKTGREYRLPTEAEWEYAARAGTATPFWWGASITTDQANYKGNDIYEGGGKKGEYRRQPLPVDSFEPNPFGLCQMHGNVWEWCADDLRSYSDAPEVDPVGSLKNAQRALRGGSWLYDARYVRPAFRFAFDRDNRFSDIGFRCARVRE